MMSIHEEVILAAKRRVAFADLLGEIRRYAINAADWAEDSPDQAELLRRFGLIDDALVALRDARDAVAAEVIASADDGDEIPGGGVLRIGGGARRKDYDTSLLRSRIIAAAAEHAGVDATVAPVDDIVDVVWQIAPISPSAEFRVRNAKRYGIDLDRYCTIERTRRTARIEGRHPSPLPDPSPVEPGKEGGGPERPVPLRPSEAPA